MYKVNNTLFRFCGCLFRILLVRASPFAGACFVFAGALFDILLVRASLFVGAYFVFAGALFHICWREPLLLLVCVSSFASEQSLHLGNLQARFF